MKSRALLYCSTLILLDLLHWVEFGYGCLAAIAALYVVMSVGRSVGLSVCPFTTSFKKYAELLNGINSTMMFKVVY